MLDFAGAFEVFSRTRLQPGIEFRRADKNAPFNVYSVARNKTAVVASGRLEVVPKYDFQSCPPVDLLVVPGGWGTRPLLGDEETLSWVVKFAPWMIERAHLELPAVRKEIRRVHEGRRTGWAVSEKQSGLFADSHEA